MWSYSSRIFIHVNSARVSWPVNIDADGISISGVVYFCTLCFFLTKKHILMLFWLVILGTCKETGTMMAFSILFFAIVFYRIC